MPSMKILLDASDAWPDMADKKVHHVTDGIEVGMLLDGMKSGRPSIAMRMDLEDGSCVFAEMSLLLFAQAADVFRARYQQVKAAQQAANEKSKGGN